MNTEDAVIQTRRLHHIPGMRGREVMAEAARIFAELCDGEDDAAKVVEAFASFEKWPGYEKARYLAARKLQGLDAPKDLVEIDPELVKQLWRELTALPHLDTDWERQLWRQVRGMEPEDRDELVWCCHRLVENLRRYHPAPVSTRRAKLIRETILDAWTNVSHADERNYAEYKPDWLKGEPEPVSCLKCYDMGVCQPDPSAEFDYCECLAGLREKSTGGNFLRLMREARSKSLRPALAPNPPRANESRPVSIASTRYLAERRCPQCGAEVLKLLDGRQTRCLCPAAQPQGGAA